MESSVAQLMLQIVQQNQRLIDENNELHRELAKYRSIETVSKIVEIPSPEPVKPEVKPKRKYKISEKGHAAHVASGKLLAIRNELIRSAKAASDDAW